MKKTKTIILSLFFLMGYSQISYSQTNLEAGVDSVLSALAQGTGNFTDLKSVMINLKTRAAAEFQKEQDAINAEQARLDRIQTELNKDKHREAKMLYDEWVERSKANSKLMLEREKLHERQLDLTMKKVVFKDQVKQAEQKLLATVANHLKEQLDYHNSRMLLLKQQLDEVKDMQFELNKPAIQADEAN